MSNFALNWVDFAIIGIVAFSILISVFRGFIREALSLTSWIVAIWVGFKFYAPLAEILTAYINNEHIRIGAAFFSLFVVTLILGTILGYLLAQVIQKTGLSGTDRALGIIFGVGRGVLVVALLLLVMGVSGMSAEDWWQNSQIIPTFTPLTLWLEQLLPEQLPVNFL